MKKVSSMLLMCAFVFSIVIIFSGVASALMIVGDPYIGNSWHQQFRAVDVGYIDSMEMFMESGGDFKSPDYFSDDSWGTDDYSTKYLLCSGDSILDLAFEVVFKGDLSQPLSFLFLSRYGDSIKEKVRLVWNGNSWECNPTSIPDADIMWLLGPAFIALGMLGRKKSRSGLKTSPRT